MALEGPFRLSAVNSAVKNVSISSLSRQYSYFLDSFLKKYKISAFSILFFVFYFVY